MTLGLEKELVARLIRELDDLVLDRGTVAWADTLYLAGIQRRLGNILANRIVNLRRRIADITFDLALIEAVCGKRKRHRGFIARLGFESAPVDGSSIKTGRGSGL